MGFRNKPWGVLFLVFNCLFLSNAKAQDNQNIDLDFIYNEWALSVSETHDDILVYGDEDEFIFDDIAYNRSSNLKFTSYDSTFYLKYSEWKRPPRRCGNGPKYKSPLRKASWKKGVWNVEEDGGYLFLTLEHFRAEKGRAYFRTKRLEYQILNLTEDTMVLQKITEESIN